MNKYCDLQPRNSFLFENENCIEIFEFGYIIVYCSSIVFNIFELPKYYITYD